MSDKLKKLIGIMALAVSFSACLFPSIFKASSKKVHFCSRKLIRTEIKTIPAEKNGDVKINTADREKLSSLYGVGEHIADLIIAERNENGPFCYAEDLQAVKGIGPVSLEKFRQSIDLIFDESRE